MHFRRKYSSINPMKFIANILPYVQIVLSVILVAIILFQKSDSSTGGVFGGGDGGGLYTTRRGFEKFLFILTIVVGILFAGFAFVAILIK